MSVQFNCHGTLTEENYEQSVADTRLYGPPRVAAARDILQAIVPRKSEFQIFLEAGTLLGAFRSGKMIPHDDDFDFGIYVENEASMMPSLESLKAHLDTTLPSKYRTRIITSYTKKVEVFAPDFGTYPFRDGLCHNVTVDISAFYDNEEGIVRIPHYLYDWFQTSRDNILPFTTILYEGHMFPAPCNPEQLLIDTYGYIGEGAVYDPETKKYKKRK